MNQESKLPFWRRVRTFARDHSLTLSVLLCLLVLAATAGFLPVPGEILGAVIGAGIALIATSIQLRHDRNERATERTFNLQRDVYLELAKAAAAPVHCLSALGNLDVTMAEHFERIKDAGAEMMKVHVTGDLPTIRTVTDANTFFSEAVLEIAELRLPLEQLVFHQRQLAEDGDRIARDEQNVLAALKSLAGLAGLLQQGEKDRLMRLLDELRQRNRAVWAEHTQLAATRMEQHMRLQSLCVQKSLDYGKKLIQVNLEVRREMGNELHALEYEALLTAASARQQARFNQFLSSVAKLLRPEK